MTPDLIRSIFRKNGAVWPLPAFSQAEIAGYRQDVLDAVKTHDLMNSDYRCKSQVLFKWMADIALSDNICQYVEMILGPSFHCWDTLFWIKEPNDGKFVSMHQDATYWNFTPKNGLTIWLAFNDVVAESGAVQYALGSHALGQQDHKDVKSEGNLLMRGQTVQSGISDFALAEVPAGHISMHHPFIVHGSGPNNTSTPRIACGMIFAADDVKPIARYSEECTLWARGTDFYHNMLHDPRPGDNWEENVRNWKLAYDRQHENYYKMQVASGDAV